MIKQINLLKAFAAALLFTAGMVMFALCNPVPEAAASTAAIAEKPENIPAILQRIIDERDSAACDTRLDFDGLMGNFLDEALPYLKEAAVSGKIRLEGPLPMLLSALSSDQPAARMAARMMLSSETRKFVLYGVNSGSFAGSPLPPEQLSGLDGGLFASFGKISAARKEFRGGKLLKQDNDSAEIATTLFDLGSRKSYNLTLGLKKHNSRWKVISIRNAATLLDSLLVR